MFRRSMMAGAVVSLAVVAGAWAEPPAEKPPVLSGPRVGEPGLATRPRSIVERDLDGSLKRLESDPIAAALAMLDLDEASSAAARGVIEARERGMDSLVRDHLREVAELSNARQAGDKTRVRELTRALLTAAGPMLQKGPLIDQVCAVIPSDSAGELRAMVSEYETALREETAKTAGAQRRQGRLNGAIAERLEGFGHEIKRAYERTFGARQKEFQELIATLDLSPEQESKVQRIFTDLFQKTYGKPSRTQNATAVMEAYNLLNAEQRRKFRELAKDAFDPAPKESPAPARAPSPPTTIPTPAPAKSGPGDDPMKP